jgi:hypothetical protein
VRIIDFAHAVSYLSGAAQPAFGAGSREAAVWLDEWAPRLKRGEPEAVLAAIRALPTDQGEAASAKGTAVRYLGSRLEQLRYATFIAAGYPIVHVVCPPPHPVHADRHLLAAALRIDDEAVDDLAYAAAANDNSGLAGSSALSTWCWTKASRHGPEIP